MTTDTFPKGSHAEAEIEAIIGLADAANKMATDMMVSGEYHAMPRRWAFGSTPMVWISNSGSAAGPIMPIPA